MQHQAVRSSHHLWYSITDKFYFPSQLPNSVKVRESLNLLNVHATIFTARDSSCCEMHWSVELNITCCISRSLCLRSLLGNGCMIYCMCITTGTSSDRTVTSSVTTCPNSQVTPGDKTTKVCCCTTQPTFALYELSVGLRR